VSASPHWERSPAELVDRFGRVLERFPQLEQRKMFGYPAAFAQAGHMVTGLHGPRWVVRLDSDAQAELRGAGGEAFEPMPGRPMTGFLCLPVEIMDDEAVAGWISRAEAFTATLPPKKKKKKKRKKT
jgi:hypothetical protein